METMIETEMVEKALDTIRPALARDGGNILLVGVEGTKVKVKLIGACHGCPSSGYTLRLGVERRLKELIPAIQEIIQV
ncbi:MAG: NifU family protein [Nitrospirae bacterium]|nr:NifU family protein [Nitrospirota bacterium]MBI3605672.1 NifU family protein [Nitrospirota bacterium]